MRIELEDVQAWRNGIYGISSLMYALDHAFNGKKAKTEYIKAPLLSGKMAGKSEEQEMTEEEKSEERKKLLMNLKIMMSNFQTSKNNEK